MGEECGSTADGGTADARGHEHSAKTTKTEPPPRELFRPLRLSPHTSRPRHLRRGCNPLSGRQTASPAAVGGQTFATKRRRRGFATMLNPLRGGATGNVLATAEAGLWVGKGGERVRLKPLRLWVGNRCPRAAVRRLFFKSDGLVRRDRAKGLGRGAMVVRCSRRYPRRTGRRRADKRLQGWW